MTLQPLQLLDQLVPGTSLRGIRPKATIEDAQSLWPPGQGTHYST
ncbi:hypothetical protein [Hydrocarboniphaga sp.]|nr:hypothetical protein [Hydrocarboniphaga sp.]